MIRAEFTLTTNEIEKITLFPSDSFRFIIHSEEKNSELKELIKEWMDSYQSGKATFPTLPLSYTFLPSFSQNTLEALQRIPFGQVSTYKEIAEKIGSPRGARAVGNVCRLNLFPLVIPCHRVLATDGSLGGFAFGLEMKKKLLAFEKKLSERNRIN